jgi:hypothetical protein
MVRTDWHDEGRQEGERSEFNTQAEAMIRSLEQHGVDVTGSESGAELILHEQIIGGHAVELYRFVCPPGDNKLPN